MQDLKVKLLEKDLVWEDPGANRKHFEKLMNDVEGVDLFILPEMFTTGFTMNPQGLAEPENGETLNWMQSITSKLNAAVTGSIIVQDASGYKNRMYFIHPEGRVDFYDKRHLFSYAGENKHYIPGSEKKIVKYRGWNILLQVCFDLRFPVFSRNRLVNGAPEYDLIIYVANWPDIRVYAWDSLLKARAIENLSYVIGVNRTGKDGNGNKYSGHSIILDPLGKETEKKVEQLSFQNLKAKREKFRFLEEQDIFDIIQ